MIADLNDYFGVVTAFVFFDHTTLSVKHEIFLFW